MNDSNLKELFEPLFAKSLDEPQEPYGRVPTHFDLTITDVWPTLVDIDKYSKIHHDIHQYNPHSHRSSTRAGFQITAALVTLFVNQFEPLVN